MRDLDGSEYPEGFAPYSGSDPPKSGSDPPTIRSEYSYSYIASALESSISASGAPTDSYSSGGETNYFGLSASATTPVGGGVIEFGGYSDRYGMVGAYWNIGGAAGMRSLSLGIVSGKTQSLAGESISVSTSLGPPRPGISPNISVGVSVDAYTGRVIGSQWGVGLSVGPAVGATIAHTSTTTTEFTSLYLDYIQFLNWARYSGEYGF